MPKLKEQPYQIIIALDQLANALTWGWADETFSARCWRLRERNCFWALARRLVDVVFFWDTKERKNDPGRMTHCEWAFENERKRIHLPGAYRE